MNKDYLRAILRALETLEFDEGSQARHGLCDHVRKSVGAQFSRDVEARYAALNLWDSVRRDAFRTWPHFSGCIVYPVPPADPHQSAEAYYEENRDVLWEGRQGELRYDLLGHLKQHVEAMLASDL